MRQSKKQLAVIGDPIAHSLSPLIQNAAIEKLGIDYVFKAIRVRPNGLKAFFEKKARRLAGFNITIPHKEAALPYLDLVTPEAKIVKAVNTVLNHNGKLIGFNTDGRGYLNSLLEDASFNPKGKNVILIGAGGAAKAIAAALLTSDIKKITIANRTEKRAGDLCRCLLKHFFKKTPTHTSLVGKTFEKALRTSDLIINTTSVGLNNSSFENFPWKKLNPKALVSDIVYNPHITPFLKEAKKMGHPIHTGEGMLVHQGALALEIWTGKKPDTKLMKRVILRELKKIANIP